ncbi:MAG: 3-deoxy-D-manno-octulosonic acid transferase [Sphingobacterium sp.]
MHFLYDLAIGFYSLVLRILAPFHAKAKRWVDGRKNLFQQMEQTVEKGCKPVWFHFASLGEFEQGRSIMEAIREKYPEQKILVTFFSPSGFEIRKNTHLADYVFYLPVDTRSNARRFLTIVEPKLAVFTKYEYWYHFFNELKKQNITLLMVSAIFREEQVFFKWYGSFFRKILKNVTFFFAQNMDSVYWLKAIHITNAGLAGDTRFDRVIELPKQREDITVVERFLARTQDVLVAGSTWQPDEQLISEVLKKHSKLKVVLAPHEIHDSHLEQVAQTFPNALFFSNFSAYTAAQVDSARVLVIDNIGMLSSLYGYGTLAYVGGGFGAGIHNTLEAATFGIPVIFGPKYAKFQEAIDLLEIGAGFCIGNAAEFEQVLLALTDQNRREDAGNQARSYVREKAGATPVIMKYISSGKLLS